MGLGEKLGEVYKSIEDKYYGAVDWLDEKGLNLYPIIDRIEEHNIPSLPVALAVILLVAAGIFFGLSMLVVQQASITFIVSDYETGISLEGASVTVTSDSGAEINALTDEEGRATLVVPAGTISFEVEKSGYEKSVDSRSVAGSMEMLVELGKGVQLLDRTVQLMKTGTSELISEDLTVRFTCSNPEAEFDEMKKSVSGTIDLKVPSNCGSLVAEPVSGFTTPDGIIDVQNTSPQLFLQAIETNVGKVNVSVENRTGEALSGITVMAYGHDGLLAGTQYSSNAGTAVFDNVSTGRYYVIVHDSQGRYADFDSSLLGEQGVKLLVKDASISFDVELDEATVGKIKVMLKDSSSRQPVADAPVYLKKNGLVVDTDYSDEQGVVEFNVGENVEYELEVDADAYLIALVKNVTAGEAFNEIYLEAATGDNTQVLRVEVVDNRQLPIDNVRLVLKKADGSIYANNVVTGADGSGEFTNLPLNTYYVYAVKKGFEGKNSDPITIKPRQTNRLIIVLPIGFGNLEVLVLNDELQPVQGAVVEAINALGLEKEQEEITSLEGKAIFNFRADKKVFFRVDAEGFLPYYSIAGMPDSDSTVTTEIILAKDPGQLQVKLLGLYLDNELAPKELSPGQKYTARLLLLLPKNSSYEEAGLHLRVGSGDEGKTNIMEEDSLYLKNVFASTATILRGTSFSPPKGYAIDSGQLTTGDSKWLNVEWKSASQGAYAVEAELQVKDSASLGQMLYVSYRGWGKSGTYTRFPADAALAGAESTAAKQALYANAKQRAYTAGPSNLCGPSFCKTFGIEDIVRNLKVSVVNQYGATIGSRYRLNFLISSTADQAFTNSEIEFGSKGDGLRFGDYAITDATGVRSQGSVEGYMLSKEIGDMRKESSTFGYIEFKTEKEGSNPLTIVIKSNNQPVLSELIDIRVEAAEQLQLDVIPKEIIPGIDNQVLVRVSDEAGEAVSNAIVSVEIDETLVVSTESNGMGEIEFKLETPGAGSTLAIKAEKTGYKEALLETKIDSSILTVTPPEINERLDIALREVEKQIWFNNQTVTDLVISKLRFSSGFKELVEFEWDDDYVGEQIDADQDINVFLSIGLTEKGILVEKPMKLEGSLSIYLLSPDLQETFVQNVPVVVRISLGGDADSLKCIEINPVNWQAITSSDEEASQQFTLKNNCRVDGQEIALSDLEARVVEGNENSLGKFTVSSQELSDAKTVVLSEEYASLSDVLPLGFEGEIDIRFTPNSSIDSGTAKPKIEFRAKHASSRGEEKILAKLPVELHVSNLAKCVEVIAEEPIMVETMPLNMGFGQYSGSYNPYYSGGYGGYQAGGSGYGSSGYGGISGTGGGYGGIPGTGGGYGGIPGTGGGYLGGSTYPYPNFSSPSYTNYYDRSQDDSWRYGLGESSFIVKNNCSSAVEIDLDVGSKLRVAEDSFELQPNQDNSVRVESGYRMGKYEIAVFAGRKESQDKKQKIDSIDVIVRRQGEIDEECIQLSTNKIKLSSFIGKPVKSQIYNYCYDVGVRLPTAGNVIQFNCRVAGQPMNTYRFAEEEIGGETIRLQAPPYMQSGFQNPLAPSGGSYYAQPNPAGLYGSGEGYAATGPWGSAYGQGGLGQQGYNYSAGQNPYGSNNWAYAQVGGFGGQCELIDSVFVTDARTSGSEDGKTIQTVEFDLKPALNYRKMLCQYMSQSPFQSIFGLRVMMSQAFYRVNVDAAANVRYYNPFGGTTNKYFKVTLEDMWGIGDTIDECMRNAGQPAMSLERLLNCKERGNASATTAQSVVNMDALNLTTKDWQKNFVPQEEFEGDTFSYTADPDVLKIPPAGSQDSIIEVTPEIRDVSGVKLSFKPVATECPPPTRGGNWTIKMVVDRSSMADGLACAKVKGQVTITVSRPIFWQSPKKITLPVEVWVLNENRKASKVNPDSCGQTEPPPPIEITECEGSNGVTGRAFEQYGFDRLPFDWTWDGIKKDTCDYTEENKDEGMFCDAVQFSIELNRKAEELKEFVSKIDIKTNKDNVMEALEINEDALPSFQNSRNLFRWVKKQVRIEGNSEPIEIAGKPKVLIFFLEEDNQLLLNDKLEKTGYEAEIDVVEQNPDPLSSMSSILNKLQANTEIDEDSIVGLFEKNNKTEGYAVRFEYWGIEYNSELEKYVWTFKEYKKLHEELASAINSIGTSENMCYSTTEIPLKPAENKEEAVMCTINSIGKSSNQKIAIESSVLQDILNANLKFVVGIRHTEDLSVDDELWKKVLKEAADIESAELPDGYADFADFYYKVVDFDSLLVKDGYSKGLREDFVELYSKTEFGSNAEALGSKGTNFAGGNWKFKLEKEEAGKSIKLPSAGLYNVLLDYMFGENEWVVEFGIEDNLEQLDEKLNKQYSSNYLLSMPFDGEVGLANGTRGGYGIALRKEGTEPAKIDLAYDDVHKEKITTLGEASGGVEGGLYNLQFLKSFADVKAGKIFSVVSGKIVNSPSKPARVDILLGERQDQGSEGFLYDVLEDGKSLADKPDYKTMDWFVWKKAGGKPFADKGFSNALALTLCGQDVIDGYHGFVQDISQQANFKGLTFLPTETGYDLRLMCNQGRLANVTAIGSTSAEAGFRGGEEKKLPLTTEGNPFRNTLEYYVKLIEDERVCVNPASSSIELFWNKEELLEKTNPGQ